MTDDRIKNLERELNRLEKEYGEIGAYKEYGDVIRGVIGLTNQLDKKVQGLEAKLAKPGQRENVKGDSKYNEGILSIKLIGYIKDDKNNLGEPRYYPISISIDGRDNHYHKANDPKDYANSGTIVQKLPGGNYTVKATYKKHSKEAQITVDGNTTMEIAFDDD